MSEAPIISLIFLVFLALALGAYMRHEESGCERCASGD